MFFSKLFRPSQGSWREKCFKDNSRNGICYGCVGGDRYTNYLSYLCVDCPHLSGLSTQNQRKNEDNRMDTDNILFYDIAKDKEAFRIVEEYVKEHLDKTDKVPESSLYIVWKAKVLQNWKYLISSTLIDGMYYELTYNGDKEEWYLDAYKKFENHCIKEDN